MVTRNKKHHICLAVKFDSKKSGLHESIYFDNSNGTISSAVV